jgi:SAM-dependent methyltransferase
VSNDDSISAVAANQRVFGSSGETEYRPEFVIERFVKSSEEDYPENRWFKSFFRPSKMKNVRNPHFIFPMDGRYTDVAGDDLDQAAICNGALPRITPGLRINHYILKSLSEYRDKQSRGCADGIAHRFERYDESYFFGRDTYINTAERAFPAQFVEKVHAKEREVLGEIGSGKVASGNHVLPSKALLTAGAISDDVYLAKLMRSISEPTELGGLTLPSFPPEQTQIATVGVSGEAAVRQAWSFVSQVLPHFKRSSLFADTDKALLDFGVGWGRISRCFLRDFKVENIIGVDISERYLGICGETFPQLRTERANVFPPLSLGTATIDFIVSYSVFSHLSEVACKAWAQEFYELLRPGGVAAITTRSRAFFDTHEEYAVKKMGGAPLFNSYAAAKAKYDRGEMVHSDTEMRKPNRTHYSETFIPQSYAKEKLWPLRLVEFYSERGLAVMIFDKP